VLRVARDCLLVDRGGRHGTVRRGWVEVGARFVPEARRAADPMATVGLSFV